MPIFTFYFPLPEKGYDSYVFAHKEMLLVETLCGRRSRQQQIIITAKERTKNRDKEERKGQNLVLKGLF